MEQGEDRYWRRTSTLMWTMFAIWVFFSFVIHFFVNQLNEIQFLGFPLGFYMAAQGSLIVFASCCSSSPRLRTRSIAKKVWPRTSGGGGTMANQAQAAKRGISVSNLGKIYGLYTGGFFAFVIFLVHTRAAGRSQSVDRLRLRVPDNRRLRHHRDHLPYDGGR